MKHFYKISFGLLIILFYSAASLAKEVDGAQELAWSGHLQTEYRFNTNGDQNISWKETRLTLKSEYNSGSGLHFFSETRLTSRGFPDAKRSSDLMDEEKVAPLQVDLREAYVDLYGFLFKNVDLRIGKQRIAWGGGG